MSKEIIMVEAQERSLAIQIQTFELSQRRALMLSKSAFFPQDLKTGQDMGVANAVLCYELAERMNLSVLEVAQNINIIHNKPTFSVKFQLARLYQSGLIKGFLQFKEDANSTECTAYATMVDGTVLEGITVTKAMATAEGWRKTTGRNGQPIQSKYDTMPRLMLRKRAISFWIGDYAPQILLGMDSNNETDLDEQLEAIVTPPVNEIVETYDKETGEVYEVDLLEDIEVPKTTGDKEYTLDKLTPAERQALDEISA